MHAAQHLATYLVASGFALGELGIACFMIRDGSMHKFPRFFQYCLFNASQSLFLACMLAWASYDQYFYSYWITNAISATLSFLVIQEIFMAALRPLEGLRDLGRIAFRWVAGLMLIISILMGLSTHIGLNRVLASAVISFESSVRLMQVGLLLLLFLISSRLGLSIKGRVFGIALGMGALAVVNLVAYSLISSTGTTHLVLINQLRSGFYIAVDVTWLVYFVLPAKQESPVMVPIASPLMRWNEVAMAFGHSAGRVVYTDSAEPFLPQVERMVDRIFENGMKG